MKLNVALQRFALAYLPRGRISLVRSVIIGFSAFSVALLIRMSLEPWVTGLAFLTFYPAILVAALFGGTPAGFVTLGLGVLAGSSIWLAPVTSPLWGVGTMVAVGAFLAFGCLMIAAIHLTSTVLLALQDAEERSSLIAGEMRHRVANLLQLVQSIARLSANNCDTKEEFLSVFFERLKALSAAHPDAAGEASEVSLHGLFSALAATFGNDRLTYEGPDASVDPDTTLMLNLVLHELATNAAKYGALSSSGGHVHVSWDCRREQIHMQWLERGGPTVLPGKRKGAGSRLLESAFRGDCGSVTWFAQPEGIEAKIVFKLAGKATSGIEAARPIQQARANSHSKPERLH